MTRITERSSAYPGGVRKTSSEVATRFRSSSTMPDGRLNSISEIQREGDGYPILLGPAGGIIPDGGSLELAYEPDGEEETR